MSNYAFIDSQNINLGIKSLGWCLDWGKFRNYLRNKYEIKIAYIFIGYKSGNENLYTDLQKKGYILIFKPTMELPDGPVKGNVDAELVLHTMINFNHFDEALIASGDGDFFCLVEYLISKNKLLHLLTPNKKYSRLYRDYSEFIVRMDWLKNSLEKRKTGISGRSKP